jgi:Zn-dependent protease
MKTLMSAVSAGAVVLGAEVAYAGGPGWKILGIGISYWILLIVILLIFNLLCCWLKK